MTAMGAREERGRRRRLPPHLVLPLRPALALRPPAWCLYLPRHVDHEGRVRGPQVLRQRLHGLLDGPAQRQGRVLQGSVAWERSGGEEDGRVTWESSRVVAPWGPEDSRTLLLLLLRRRIHADPRDIGAPRTLRSTLLFLHTPQLPAWPAH